jgi:N-acyl-L-homoserine lactone synthetase
MRATEANGLTALDALSDRLLAAAPSLRVAVAATDAERQAAYRLRYAQVVGHGWMDAARLPDGVEVDDYDADALQVCAWDGEALVGTVRLVFPATGRPLPVEADFGITVEPPGEVVEAGRLVIAPTYRGDPAHRTWGTLFACAWVSMRAWGYSVLAGTAAPRTIERLRALGLPFEILGPARMHWGEARHPVRLDPARGAPRWF